jgi:hypothetical protein
MMAPPISVKLRIMAGLRPTRSAYEPMMMPPIGRVTKPAPKVASDNIRFA